MPLIHSASKDAFESNLREEIKDHPKGQALAIAYSIRRRAGGDPEPEVAKGEYKMSGKEAMGEHLRLLQVLASRSHKDDKQELERQAKEMPEIAAAVAKSERTVYLDMDGVLADYDRAAQAHGLDPAKAKDQPGFFRDLPEMEGARAAVEGMLDRGVKIVVLSTPPKGRSAEAEAEKKAWLGEHFPELAESALFTQDKGGHGGKNDILVDDHPEWSNAESFPGTIVTFKGPGTWKDVAQLTVAKSEHDLGDPPHPEPTRAQCAAGNYRMGHWKILGMDITIENLAGSTRRGVDPDGNHWEVVMPYHYGYIRNHGANHETTGADGDKIDIAVGPLMGGSDEAHIINQLDPRTGEFDEHKIFIGFPNRESAISAFRHGRSDDPDKVMGAVITVPIEELKRWIAEGCITEEAILKAEHTAHVKAHYRTVGGKVTYIPGYDKTVHGEHPEATLHQRTVYGAHKEGTHTLRATDAEDREAIKAAAAKAGVEIHHIKRAGANHHGRQSAYDHIHFSSENDAKKVHDLLATEGELATKLDAPPPKPAPAPAPAVSMAPGSDWWMKTIAPLDKVIESAYHGISEDKAEHGYVYSKTAYPVLISAAKAKLKALKDAGHTFMAQTLETDIQAAQTASNQATKARDYIEADIQGVLSEAVKGGNPQLYKLAAVISMERAKAYEAKAKPEHDNAKLWWTNAASFATLAQQK